MTKQPVPSSREQSVAPHWSKVSPGAPWRFLEASLPEESLEELLHREFPNSPWPELDSISRRRFLALMGASLSLAAAGGCEPPREEIVPYVRSEGIVAGKPLFYATAMTLGGIATGLLVEQHLGRPMKAEGNSDHPASLGATNAFAQASVLTLYDPDRSREVIFAGHPSSWAQAVEALGKTMDGQREKRGAGLRILSEAVTSPTLAQQIDLLLEELPEARWHQYEPVDYSSARAGARLAFGREVDAVYDLTKADVILALDSNFLVSGPGSLRYARQFAERRRVWSVAPENADMNRLYAVGPTPCPTSAAADHRLAIRAADVGGFLRQVASRLDVPSGTALAADAIDLPEEWITAIADDLRERRGRCLVLAGASQPPALHALVHAINEALGNVGQTVSYVRPVHPHAADSIASLAELSDDIEQGRVETLIILGSNAAYSAPADLNFASQLVKVPFTLHLGLYRDETARLCQWHIPEAHYLESWGDARAFDGTVSIIQPLIAPLYGGLSSLQLVAALHGRSDTSAYDLVRDFWREQWDSQSTEVERQWNEALHDGVVPDSAFPVEEVTVREAWWNAIEDNRPDHAPVDAAELEVVFQPDPTIYDGRFSNNAWLQELPKPLTQLTWDNVAAFGPATAARLGLELEIGKHGGDVMADEVRLEYRGRSILAPAWILPGHAENSATVYLGYGRTSAGDVANGAGYNAYSIRTSERPWFDGGLIARKTGRRHRLATTQLHHLMHGHDVVRTGTLDEYQNAPHSPAKKTGSQAASRSLLPILDSSILENRTDPAPPSIYPEYAYTHHKWGMVIDQTACIGCSDCVLACQAENNIPVVGKEEVCRGREMHWLRVDSYYEAEDAKNSPATFFQPVPCMHCEKAPCEVVCPVNATVHSDEGLNDMVYNRCVGTRYCSNNCPYKVRRFNFFQYADWETESLKALRNPDVTVRSRGVMEKCTYCVQRINAARSYAEQDDRPLVLNRAGQWVKPIYDNELLTACQAACPTQAIVFGDLNSPHSQVAKMRYDEPLNYGLLNEELGTQPRTTYLAALRNPNPAFAPP